MTQESDLKLIHSFKLNGMDAEIFRKDNFGTDINFPGMFSELRIFLRKDGKFIASQACQIDHPGLGCDGEVKKTDKDLLKEGLPALLQWVEDSID